MGSERSAQHFFLEKYLKAAFDRNFRVFQRQNQKNLKKSLTGNFRVDIMRERAKMRKFFLCAKKVYS